VLTNHRDGEPVDKLSPVLDAAQVCALQAAVKQVNVDDAINDYMLDIIAATRTHPELALGVSTRGAVTLYRAVQGMALVENRDYAVPDDVKRLVMPVLAHRVVCRGLLRQGQRARAKSIILQIMTRIPAPR
jgi:MoxR-like ATPase